MKIVFNPKTLFKRDNFIKRAYYRTRSFFKYSFSKPHRDLMVEAWTSRPWDHSYLYQLEYEKIKEMVQYHEAHKSFVDVEYVIRDMKLCLSLLEIMLERRSLFHFDGNLIFVDTEEKDEDGNPLKELKGSPDFKYRCDVKVNLRNMKRFVSNEKAYESYNKMPHELYELKAKRLYHKIRYERDGTWWD